MPRDLAELRLVDGWFAAGLAAFVVIAAVTAGSQMILEPGDYDVSELEVVHVSVPLESPTPEPRTAPEGAARVATPARGLPRAAVGRDDGAAGRRDPADRRGALFERARTKRRQR